MFLIIEIKVCVGTLSPWSFLLLVRIVNHISSTRVDRIHERVRFMMLWTSPVLMLAFWSLGVLMSISVVKTFSLTVMFVFICVLVNQVLDPVVYCCSVRESLFNLFLIIFKHMLIPFGKSLIALLCS